MLVLRDTILQGPQNARHRQGAGINSIPRVTEVIMCISSLTTTSTSFHAGTSFIIANITFNSILWAVDSPILVLSAPSAPFSRFRFSLTYQLVSCSMKPTRRGTTV